MLSTCARINGISLTITKKKGHGAVANMCNENAERKHIGPQPPKSHFDHWLFSCKRNGKELAEGTFKIRFWNLCELIVMLSTCARINGISLTITKKKGRGAVANMCNENAERKHIGPQPPKSHFDHWPFSCKRNGKELAEGTFKIRFWNLCELIVTVFTHVRINGISFTITKKNGRGAVAIICNENAERKHVSP